MGGNTAALIHIDELMKNNVCDDDLAAAREQNKVNVVKNEQLKSYLMANNNEHVITDFSSYILTSCLQLFIQYSNTKHPRKATIVHGTYVLDSLFSTVMYSTVLHVHVHVHDYRLRLRRFNPFNSGHVLNSSGKHLQCTRTRFS